LIRDSLPDIVYPGARIPGLTREGEMRRAAIAAAAVVVLFARDARAQEAPSIESSSPPAAQAVDDQRRDTPSWDAEVAAARAVHDDWLACVRAKRFKCDDKSKPDPMAALLNDDTLVSGDVVVTPQGPKVFRGQPQTPHRREDFQ
jgi:hypothetical protein